MLIAWSGKDPAEIIAHRGVSNPTPEQIEMIRVEMGLDQPLPVRYIQWLSGMFTGELGTSLTTHQPIVKDLHKYLATTTSLVGMAILWIIVLTVPISLLCARKRNRLFDQVTRGITICGICVPTFWLGFLLLLFFAIHLKWFSVLPSPGWRGFLLPSFALAVPSSCSLIRIMRSSLLAELSSDYVRFAKARGLSANRILVCHILRNALPPVVTIFFQQFGFLIAGGAVIESVFSIKGIGTYLVDSVIAADTIAVSTCIVVIAAIFVVANFMADIINRLLCPWMVREEMIHKLLKRPQAIIGLCLIAIVIVIAIAAPAFSPHDPELVNLSQKYAQPDAEYPLGTDQLGRCTLSRLLYGARYSIGISLPVLLILSVIGLIVGTFSACAGEKADHFITILCDVFIAFPSLIIAIAVIGVLGNGLQNIAVSVVIATWAWFVRIVRSYSVQEMGKDYILAARISGCNTGKLVFRHLIPNILPQFLVYVSTGVASSIIMVSSFAFLGLGLPSGTPEWGAMLNDARTALYSHPELLIYPGLCIFVTAAGFNLFGEALRDILMPEEDSL